MDLAAVDFSEKVKAFSDLHKVLSLIKFEDATTVLQELNELLAEWKAQNNTTGLEVATQGRFRKRPRCWQTHGSFEGMQDIGSE